jgi:hypothetical protein
MYVIVSLVLALCAVTSEAAPVRFAYTKAGKPEDCVAIATTTPAECAIKASRCMQRFNIAMTFFKAPCDAPDAKLGCQCDDRCNCTCVP